MLTVKAIGGRGDHGTEGFEATNYKHRHDAHGLNNSVEFWGPCKTGGSITLAADNYERIVVENAAGKTIENVVEPRDDLSADAICTAALPHALVEFAAQVTGMTVSQRVEFLRSVQHDHLQNSYIQDLAAAEADRLLST